MIRTRLHSFDLKRWKWEIVGERVLRNGSAENVAALLEVKGGVNEFYHDVFCLVTLVATGFARII